MVEYRFAILAATAVKLRMLPRRTNWIHYHKEAEENAHYNELLLSIYTQKKKKVKAALEIV